MVRCSAAALQKDPVRQPLRAAALSQAGAAWRAFQYAVSAGRPARRMGAGMGHRTDCLKIAGGEFAFARCQGEPAAAPASATGPAPSMIGRVAGGHGRRPRRVRNPNCLRWAHGVPVADRRCGLRLCPASDPPTAVRGSARAAPCATSRGRRVNRRRRGCCRSVRHRPPRARAGAWRRPRTVRPGSGR